MSTFSQIIIIYNPNSTGDSKSAAYELRAQLKKELADAAIHLWSTKYAGHAEELAYKAAKRFARPLIISSSGDGGYNEVINGGMRAGNPQGVFAVLPAGNANDHSRTMQDRPLWQLIKKGRIIRIDLLQMQVRTPDGSESLQYAHSYIGLGLTPVIAAELNRHTLNAFREVLIVIKKFYKYRPFKIRRGNKKLKLNSLIFGNINQMAKVLTLAKENKPADGKFEVIMFPASKKRQLLRRLMKATVSSLETKRKESVYAFEVIKKMPVQLDGEVKTIKPGSKVIISSAHKALRTIA